MRETGGRPLATDAKDPVVWEAQFNPQVRTYWLMGGALVLAITVVGILLLPVWFFVGTAITERYLRRMRCTLTEKSLAIGKGIWFRVEKTIPLDKITDVGLVQGPLMRYFDLEALSVETAGQSSEGALVNLVGVVDTRRFRDAVLRQKELLTAARIDEAGRATGTPAAQPLSSEALLVDIRDTLRRIERRLPSGDRS
jgi:putative membrane protein